MPSKDVVYCNLRFTGKDVELIHRLKDDLDKDTGHLTDTALMRIALRALAQKRGVEV